MLLSIDVPFEASQAVDLPSKIIQLALHSVIDIIRRGGSSRVRSESSFLSQITSILRLILASSILKWHNYIA